MRLRRQLLALGSLSLLLPLVGWHGVQALDASLREGRIAAQRLALAELELSMPGPVGGGTSAGPPRPPPRTSGDVYAAHAPAPIEIDGYDDDWRELPGPGVRIVDEAGGMSVRAAEHGDRLYLMIDLSDRTRVYHRPPRLSPEAGEGEQPDAQTRLANGDALQLFLATSDERHHVLLSPIAPGPSSVLVASPGDAGNAGGARGSTVGMALDDWQAAWVERAEGYRVEVSMPLPPTADGGNRLGIAAIDVPSPGAPARVRATLTPRTMRLLHARADRPFEPYVPGLYQRSRPLQRLLLERVPDGARARILDPVGRLLADVDRLNRGPVRDGTPFASIADAILFRLFSFLLARDLPLPAGGSGVPRLDATGPTPIEPGDPTFQRLSLTRRYVTPELDRVIGTVRAIGPQGGGGWLWYENNEEHSSAYAGSRVARAFSLLLLSGLSIAWLVFGWAAGLSLRVCRLARVARRAVSTDGRVRADGLPFSRSGDELGELSRDLTRLLERSADTERGPGSPAGGVSEHGGVP